jgi:methylmalonyl-CoA mutase C-terminal domain/subunit
MVVEAALQEDVDIIGLSILSGAHVPLVTSVLELLKAQKAKLPIFVGGIIPADDAKHLKAQGVAAVFGPGTAMADIVQEIRRVLKA